MNRNIDKPIYSPDAVICWWNQKIITQKSLRRREKLQKHGFQINRKSVFSHFIRSQMRFLSNYFFIGSENDWITGIYRFVNVSAHFGSFWLFYADFSDMTCCANHHAWQGITRTQDGLPLTFEWLSWFVRTHSIYNNQYKTANGHLHGLCSCGSELKITIFQHCLKICDFQVTSRRPQTMVMTVCRLGLVIAGTMSPNKPREPLKCHRTISCVWVMRGQAWWLTQQVSPEKICIN